MAYTTIDDPSAHFQTMIFTGDGNDNRALTNDGNSDLQPDWIWFKNRATTNGHNLLDSTRGVGKTFEGTNSTGAEGGTSTRLTSFDSDGFTVRTDPSVNGNTNGIVAWQWKANGGTTTSQTGSDIDSVTQVNTTAKFSIMTYTGAANAEDDNSNNSGAYWRVKHGLGSTPKLAIFKGVNHVSAWYMWHHSFGGTQDQKTVQFNNAEGKGTESDVLFGNTDWSSTEIEIGGWSVVNRKNLTYIAYMFDEVQGYSKFGKYTGNGNVDGAFVYTGFKPAFVIQKQINANGEYWMLKDSAREPSNQADANLYPNVTNVEGDTNGIDLLSNGFKCRTTGAGSNASSATYMYIAFAEQPFVTSTGIPATAR